MHVFTLRSNCQKIVLKIVPKKNEQKNAFYLNTLVIKLNKH